MTPNQEALKDMRNGASSGSGQAAPGLPAANPAHELPADGAVSPVVRSRHGSAIISDCGLYRYRLERHGLSGAGAVAWLMVNPSTADATEDDATIRKVMGFTERLGGGWAIVGNKFAYRATDIKALRHVADPRGPENDAHLERIMREAPVVIAAWGPLAKLPDHLRRRWRVVCGMADRIGVQLMCLGAARDGQPRHPLMLAYDTPLIPWRRP